MSQESTTSKKQRRTQRNRPTLVTSAEQYDLVPAATETTVATTEAPASIAETSEPLTPAAKRPARLPNFFSKVTKSEQETSTKEADVIQARLARAQKKGTAAATTTTQESDDSAATAKAPVKAAPTIPARPKLFKTRHIFGFVIYLLAADTLLPIEATLAKAAGVEKVLFSFPLFGSQLTVTTSFLFNIVTLLLLLWLLVKLDFLPRSLTGTGANRTPVSGKSTSNRNNQNTPVVKVAPPPMKQGIQGEHDNLYQAYRAGQRRDKKR